MKSAIYFFSLFFLPVQSLRRTVARCCNRQDPAELADMDCVQPPFDMLYKLPEYHRCLRYFHPGCWYRSPERRRIELNVRAKDVLARFFFLCFWTKKNVAIVWSSPWNYHPAAVNDNCCTARSYIALSRDNVATSRRSTTAAEYRSRRTGDLKIT